MLKLLAVVLFASLSAVYADIPVSMPPTHPYRPQEGFSANAINKLKSGTSALQDRLGPSAAVAQSVISRLQVSVPGEFPLMVPSLGRSKDFRKQILTVVQAWANSSGVRFDFGTPAVFRERARQDAAYHPQILIALDETGYWSWVGPQSIDPSLATSDEDSMNFEPVTQGLATDWQSSVLHEFGRVFSRSANTKTRS